jgi:mitochondrial GTPase 1
VQDFVVKAVRQILFESISSSKMDPGKVDEIRSLIDCQIVSLQEAFKVSTESSEDKLKSVALKLLNLYRTGRLGRYTLDHIPDDGQEVTALIDIT